MDKQAMTQAVEAAMAAMAQGAEAATIVKDGNRETALWLERGDDGALVLWSAVKHDAEAEPVPEGDALVDEALALWAACEEQADEMDAARQS